MKIEEIKPGQVVQLASGGPLMTVQEITGDKVRAAWFDGLVKQADLFVPETLVDPNKREFAF